MIIHSYPSRVFVFCTDQIGKLNGKVGMITTPESLKSFILALNSANPPEMCHCFQFIIFLDRDHLLLFHLAFSNIIVSTLLVRQIMWLVILPVSAYGYTIYVSWNWRSNHKISLDTLKDRPELNSTEHLTSIGPFPDRWTSPMFWVSSY